MAARVTNQSTITGPNMTPTRCVPKRCTMKRPSSTPTEIGSTQGLSDGRHDLQALGRAEHRDRRGDDAVAVEQGRAEHADQEQRARAATACARPSAPPAPSSAMMPPSPLLSARRISSTYLSVTTNISPQKIVDTAPTMCARVERDADAGAEDLLHRVERAGADVAVDDADRAEGEGRQALAAGGFIHVWAARRSSRHWRRLCVRNA